MVKKFLKCVNKTSHFAVVVPTLLGSCSKKKISDGANEIVNGIIRLINGESYTLD